MECKRPLAVDAIIEMNGGIVIIERKYGKFKGYYALPGGMVERHETLIDAVKREVMEETGLELSVEGLAGIYSSPSRDPRGVVTVVFHGKGKGKLEAGDDASSAMIATPEEALKMKLAFDHEKIIRNWMDGRRCVYE